VLLLAGCSSAERRAEQIGCTREKNPRSVQICWAIAKEMEFELMGHAVPAPGYKITNQTLVRAYCRLGLSKADESALRQLRGAQGASKDLLQMLGVDWVDPGNILSSANPNYILKDGCPGR
jgi:hypothetical protein